MKKLTRTGFNQWLEVFLDEKGYDLADQAFTCEIGGFWGTAIVGGDVLLNAFESAPISELEVIKRTLVKIDFVNGRIHDYFQHLATALSKMQFGGDS